MKLINPKFAAAACLFGMLAAPAAVFADHPRNGGGGDDKKDKKWAVPEPSTLVMALAGMGLAIGLAVVGLRRNRSRSVTA
jgi:hypothetical protein